MSQESKTTSETDRLSECIALGISDMVSAGGRASSVAIDIKLLVKAIDVPGQCLCFLSACLRLCLRCIEV